MKTKNPEALAQSRSERKSLTITDFPVWLLNDYERLAKVNPVPMSRNALMISVLAEHSENSKEISA